MQGHHHPVGCCGLLPGSRPLGRTLRVTLRPDLQPWVAARKSTSPTRASEFQIIPAELGGSPRLPRLFSIRGPCSSPRSPAVFEQRPSFSAPGRVIRRVSGHRPGTASFPSSRTAGATRSAAGKVRPNGDDDRVPRRRAILNFRASRCCGSPTPIPGSSPPRPPPYCQVGSAGESRRSRRLPARSPALTGAPGQRRPSRKFAPPVQHGEAEVRGQKKTPPWATRGGEPGPCPPGPVGRTTRPHRAKKYERSRRATVRGCTTQGSPDLYHQPMDRTRDRAAAAASPIGRLREAAGGRIWLNNRDFRPCPAQQQKPRPAASTSRPARRPPQPHDDWTEAARENGGLESTPFFSSGPPKAIIGPPFGLASCQASAAIYPEHRRLRVGHQEPGPWRAPACRFFPPLSQGSPSPTAKHTQLDPCVHAQHGEEPPGGDRPSAACQSSRRVVALALNRPLSSEHQRPRASSSYLVKPLYSPRDPRPPGRGSAFFENVGSSGQEPTSPPGFRDTPS